MIGVGTNENIIKVHKKYKRLIRYFAEPYKHLLSPDEIKSCCMLAILNALQRYNHNPKVKFKNYLGRWIRWEILNFLKMDRPEKYNNTLPLEEDILVIDEDINIDINDACIDAEDEGIADIVYYRTKGKMSFEDIAIINGCSREKARILFTNFVNKLKEEGV